MMSSALPHYLVPLGPKYLPQDPIFENPQPTRAPTSLSQAKFHTHTNNMEN